jgi:BASS family bile acid:Na+ symporter
VLTASLLVLATAPGGPVLVKWVTLAKGDPALAVGLVVILLLVGVTTQPLVLPILLDGVTVSAGAIVRTLIFTVLAPLLVGLALRARRPLLAAWLQLPLRRVSTVSMVLVVTLLPGVHWRELSELAGTGALPAAVLFVVLSATAGWVIGGPQAGPRRILALCCGQPNMAAAFVIANQNFSDPRVMLMLLLVMIASLPILLPLTLFLSVARCQVMHETVCLGPEAPGRRKGTDYRRCSPVRLLSEPRWAQTQFCQVAGLRNQSVNGLRIRGPFVCASVTTLCRKLVKGDGRIHRSRTTRIASLAKP